MRGALVFYAAIILFFTLAIMTEGVCMNTCICLVLHKLYNLPFPKLS